MLLDSNHNLLCDAADVSLVALEPPVPFFRSSDLRYELLYSAVMLSGILVDKSCGCSISEQYHRNTMNKSLIFLPGQLITPRVRRKAVTGVQPFLQRHPCLLAASSWPWSASNKSLQASPGMFLAGFQGIKKNWIPARSMPE